MDMCADMRTGMLFKHGPAVSLGVDMRIDMRIDMGTGMGVSTYVLAGI